MGRYTHHTAGLRSSLQRWGWPGATGLVLLLLAAVLAVTWLPDLAQRSRHLSAVAAEAEQQVRRERQRSATPQAVQSPAQRFASAFPEPELREARVAALLTSARAHGLSFKTGEFQLTQEAQLGLLKYSINMPLSGPYAQLRSFVEHMQNADTALVLERMRLQRKSARDTAVDADMTWSFYMRSSASELAASVPLTKPLASVSSPNLEPAR